MNHFVIVKGATVVQFHGDVRGPSTTSTRPTTRNKKK